MKSNKLYIFKCLKERKLVKQINSWLYFSLVVGHKTWSYEPQPTTSLSKISSQSFNSIDDFKIQIPLKIFAFTRN